MNILGFMNQANELHTFENEGSINSAFVVASIDKWITETQIDTTEKMTILVLDNAPIHHSELFKKQIRLWEEKNLFIFFLPKYSPHLNKIETLWRKTKYEWIRPEDYSSYKTLKQAVLNIFSLVGEKYKINFKS